MGTQLVTGGQDAQPGPIVEFLRVACRRAGVGGPLVEGGWARVVNGPVADRGWKIHVSAWTTNALEVLSRAVPVLLEQAVPFKTAASLAQLEQLNLGLGGASQVGKYITVYPPDDVAAVEVAALLDRATNGLAGPQVPTDRCLRPGSVVSYRYGAMSGGVVMQTAVGMLLPAFVGADGTITPDVRGLSYRAPSGVVDPFETASLYQAPAQSPRLVAGRFVPVVTVHRSPRSTIQVAVDVERLQRCVLKRVSDRHAPATDGAGPRDRLRREAALLARLAGTGVVARVHECVELVDETILVTEDLGPLDLLADGQRRGFGAALPLDELTTIGLELAGAVERLHQNGIAHRDLKTVNVMRGEDGRLRLVDLENATDRDTVERVGGTAGYVPPEMGRCGATGVVHDVYSYGAVLYFLATGAEPSLAPSVTNLLSRPVRLVNPDLPEAVSVLIGRCLDPDPDERYSSMAEVIAAWEEWRVGATAPVVASPAQRWAVEDNGTTCARTQAAEVLRSLDRAARPISEEHVVWIDDADGLAWPGRDLATGVAGVALAVVELAAELGVLDEHRRLLHSALSWLESRPRPLGDPPIGLYLGDAGVGAALLRAGVLLEDHRWVQAAGAIGQRVAALPWRSPDVFNGLAGALRFELMLAAATSEGEPMAAAIAMGDWLLGSAETSGAGWCWRFPPGYDSLSGEAQLGYAHGAAGIADVLLDLGSSTGEPRFIAAANASLDLIEHCSVAVLDGRGLGWPARPDETVHAPVWCHGAAGVAQVFLTAARLGVRSGAGDIARRAAESVIGLGGVIGPTQCHGLAGSVELVLDLYQYDRDPRWLGEAERLHQLLDAFSRPDGDGLAWLGDGPGRTSSSYMTGSAGVAMTCLRLADPERRPRQLTLAGFGFVPG